MNTSLLLKIFPGVIVLLLAIALITMYTRARNLTISEFKRTITRKPPIRLWMFLLTFVFGAAFVTFYVINASHSASAVVTLNYAEASSAENANGTRYNMAEIICPEVLERAIEKGGLEDVNASQLQECVKVSPLVQGDAYDKDSYHIATEFLVEYNATKDTRHLDAKNVVRLITHAYKDFYIDNYADNFSILEMSEDPDFSQMDYLDTVAYLDKQASIVQNYMYGLADRNSSFTSSSGDTFNSVAARMYQINDVQIKGNLRSYILHGGISRNASGYIGRLQYENNLLSYDEQRATASFEVRNDAVSMYAEEMTRVVLVPTWDQDGTYYMGRTRVGIDELSIEAEQYSQEAADYLEDIEDNRAVIAAMSTAQYSGADPEADRLISEINSSIKSLAAAARAIGQEYSETRMNKCITATVYGTSFTKYVVNCAVISLVFYAALTLLIVARRLPKVRKDGIPVSESTYKNKKKR